MDCEVWKDATYNLLYSCTKHDKKQDELMLVKSSKQKRRINIPGPAVTVTQATEDREH